MGKEIAVKIYQSTAGFPKIEQYGLTDQIRRAAVSIPSNIAEGFNRFHPKEYQHFLFIALGSCGELETQIIISHELRYLSETEHNELIDKISTVARGIRRLISVISSSQQ